MNSLVLLVHNKALVLCFMHAEVNNVYVYIVQDCMLVTIKTLSNNIHVNTLQ